MIAGVQDRLSAQVPALRTVEGAVEFAALQKPPLDAKLPAAFVMAAEDRAAPNTMASQVLRQEVTRTIRVVLFVRSLRDARGAAAAEQLETLMDAVRDALIGWLPPGARKPLELQAGALLGFSDQTVAWAEDFTCTFNIEKRP